MHVGGGKVKAQENKKRALDPRPCVSNIKTHLFVETKG